MKIFLNYAGWTFLLILIGGSYYAGKLQGETKQVPPSPMGNMAMEGMKPEMEMAGMDMKDMDKGGMPMKVESQAKRSKKARSYILNLDFTPEPPHVGENKVSLKITDPKNQIIRDADVTFSYTMTMPGMMVEEVKGKLVKEVYEGTLKFAMGGEWKVDVSVKRKGQTDAKESFILQVK